MAKTKTYKVGNEVYDIPENETQEFLSSFKDAVEVESYIVGEDTFDIPLAEIKDFKVEFPNAEPLKKKVGTEPIQPDLGSGGTASASAVPSTESEGGLFSPIYMGKTKIDEEEVDVFGTPKVEVKESPFTDEMKSVLKTIDTEALVMANEIKKQGRTPTPAEIQGIADKYGITDRKQYEAFEKYLKAGTKGEKTIEPQEYKINGLPVAQKEFRSALFDKDNIDKLQDGTLKLEYPQQDEEISNLVERQKNAGTRTGDLFDSLMQGAGEMMSGIIGIPSYVNRALRTIPFYSDLPPTDAELITKNISKGFKNTAEKFGEKIRAYEDGFIGAIKSGEIGNAVSMTGNMISNMIPIVTLGVVTAPAGAVGSAGILATTMASSELAGSDNIKKLDKTNLTEGEKVLRATLIGGAEGVFGALPTAKILGKNLEFTSMALINLTNKAAQVGGAEVAEQYARASGKEVATQLLKEMGIDQAQEVFGEMLTTGAQLVTDNALGVSNKSGDEILNEMLETGALTLSTIPFLELPRGAKIIKSYTDGKLIKGGLKGLKDKIKTKVKLGTLTEEQGAEAELSLEKREKAVNAVPTNLQENTEVVDLIEKKQELEEKEKQIDPIFKTEIEKEKAEIEVQIQGLINQIKNEPTTTVSEPIQQTKTTPQEQGVKETVSESITEDSGGGAETAIAVLEQPISETETTENVALRDVESTAKALGENKTKNELNTPLSKKQFDKKYVAQHKDLKGKRELKWEDNKKSILQNGLREGVNVNALPISEGGEPRNAIDRDYGNKKGDIVYILPKEGITEGRNGYKTKEGYIPKNTDIVVIEYDKQSTYEAYKNQYSKNISEAYHAAKAKPETTRTEQEQQLVKAVESLLSKEQAPPALKDVESTAKALELQNMSDADLQKAYEQYSQSNDFDLRVLSSMIENIQEKNERNSIINSALNKVSEVIDNILSGNEYFIEKSEGREAKSIAQKYMGEVSKKEAQKDFKDAFFGNPESWVADALKMRESVRVYIENGGTFKDLLSSVKREFESDGFTEQDAASVIKNKLEGLSKKDFRQNQISEAYHKAKADGTNPELVKAVEQLLTPKTETNAKEQQNIPMREQGVQDQPQMESDSNMPIVNEAELQDREVVEEEVNVPFIEESNVYTPELLDAARRYIEALEKEDSASEVEIGTPTEQAIAKRLGKIDKRSFIRFGDSNKITMNLAKNWFAKKSDMEGKRSAFAIDVIAEEIGVTPEDIVSFIIAYPSGIGTPKSASKNTFIGANKRQSQSDLLKYELDQIAGKNLSIQEAIDLADMSMILSEQYSDKLTDEDLDLLSDNPTQEEINELIKKIENAYGTEQTEIGEDIIDSESQGNKIAEPKQSEQSPEEIVKKDIDDAKKSLDENLNKINKLFDKPKDKNDDKIFSQLIPKSIFGLPFRAVDLAEKYIYEKIVVPVGDAAAKSLRKGMESSNAALNEAATQVQGLIRTAPLTTEEITTRRRSIGEINSSILRALRFYENAVNSIGKDAQSLRNIHMVLDPEVYEKMGETPLTYDDLNDTEKNLHDLLRATNDAIHDWHFINGKIDKETYDANKGKYIARFYEEIEFDDAPSSFKKSFTDISKQMNFGYVKQRKDLDEITLKALEDPVYGTARRLGQMLKNQAIIDYANQASTRVKTFSEGDTNIPNNYVKLEGGGEFGNIKIWGDLTNKYVPIDLAEDLKGYMFLSDAAQKAYDFNKAYDRLSIRQFYKKLNTVYNPLVHVGNAVSNFSFSFWTGIDPISLISNVPQAAKEVRENGDIYLELAREGVVASDVVTKDLTKSSKDILTQTNQANNSAGAFRKAFEKFDEFVTDKYANTDDIAKVAAYITLTKDYKVPPKEAAKRVFDGFQNYSQVGRLYDFTSKTPIFGNPYVKFKADLLRIIKNGLLRKPLTMIGYLMLLKGFADLMSNLADEDEEDRRRREARPFIPKIPFPKSLGGDIPLVFQTKYGEVNAARYFSPFYIYDDANKSGVLEKASQFAPISLKEYRDRPIPLPAINDVLFGSIVQAVINEDFRGKRIQDPSGTKFQEGVESSEEKLINALNYIARQQVPFYSKTQDLINALNGDPDFYGRNKDLTQSLISSVIKIEQMGNKEIKENVQKNVEFAMKDLQALEALKKKANVEYEKKAEEIQNSTKTETQKEKEIKSQIDILTKRLAQLTEKQAKVKSNLLQATGESVELKKTKSSKPQMGLPKQNFGKLPKQKLGQ
jgi:hypothetical protein